MASPRRVTVVDNLCSRKQVRELLGIRDPKHEQRWKKFEQQSFNAFRFDGFDLDPTQKWLHLPSKDADTTIAEMRRLYQKFGPEAPISEEDLDRLAEWRAYNLHKTDRKRFMDSKRRISFALHVLLMAF
ncbi:MAG: hypothetical protein Q9225_002702 [Loekoesia sp. 1 TL-2023]